MKIAINGAGIAGPALAHWLLRSGHEPTLIEKADEFRTGGYVIDFWGTGYTVAERMGILPRVKEAGYSVTEVRLVDHRGVKTGGFHADVFRQIANDRFTSLPRGDLAKIIHQTIENQVETLFGNSISAIEQTDAGVHVSFQRGAARHFDLVVGADGLHSTVRWLVFGPEEKFERQLGYWVAAFEVADYHPRDELVYVSHGEPGREIARFSLRNNRTMFLFVFLSDRTTRPLPRGCEERKAILREVFGDLGWETSQILRSIDQVQDVYFDRVSQIKMDRWSSGRVVLIGDAATCVSLMAGEGTGLAMTQAYVLAGELNRAGNNRAAAFSRYETLLRPLIESKQKSARTFASAFAPKTWFGIWLRNQVTKCLAIRPVAHFLLARDMRDRFDLPAYEM